MLKDVVQFRREIADLRGESAGAPSTRMNAYGAFPAWAADGRVGPVSQPNPPKEARMATQRKSTQTLAEQLGEKPTTAKAKRDFYDARTPRSRRSSRTASSTS